MKVRLFCLLVCVYLAFQSVEPPWADGKIMFESAKALIDDHTLELKIGGPAFFFTVRDGKKYGLYPLGNVLALMPAYLVYKALAFVPGAPALLLHNYTSKLSPALLAAAVCVLFFVVALRQGARERVAFWLALALGLQTIMFVYARVPWSEPLQALLLLVIFERALALAERPTVADGVIAGLAAGWLLNTKVLNLLPILVAAAYVVVRGREQRRQMLRAALGGAAVLVPLCIAMLAQNRLKTGSWLDSGYSAAGGDLWTAGVYDALHGYLLSPGRSYLAYSPILLLGLLGLPSYYRQDRARALLLLGMAAALLLPYLRFRSWYGGHVWGPRYLVPLTPLLLLPAAPWLQGVVDRGIKRASVAGLATLSLASQAVQILGGAFYWDHFIRIAQNLRAPLQDERLGYVVTVFVPELSPIPGHLWMLKHKLLGGDLFADMPWHRILNTPKVIASIFASVPVDLWFPTWFRTPGTAPIWAGIMLALCATGIAWSAWGIRRRWKAPNVMRSCR